MGRLIAVGDIHGHSWALWGLLDLVEIRPDDELVLLGDLIDRGPDGAGVLDIVLDLARQCTVHLVMGNHEEMVLAAMESKSELKFWRHHGGSETMRSWGLSPRLAHPAELSRSIPSQHLRLIRDMKDYHEAAEHIFVHAGYHPARKLSEQSSTDLRWGKLPEDLGPYHSPAGEIKTAWCGHTPQPSVLDRGHLVCLDTGCGLGGVLSAADVRTRAVWQVDEGGASAGTYRLGAGPQSSGR